MSIDKYKGITSNICYYTPLYYSVYISKQENVQQFPKFIIENLMFDRPVNIMFSMDRHDVILWTFVRYNYSSNS